MTIGGNMQNSTGFGIELAPYSGGGPSGDVPANLLGYNVYRDGGFVAYTDHVGGNVQQMYIDENLQPAVYCYTVTAVYDLGTYGFPGQTDESMEEGPACVPVDYCFDLEFMETWALGNFDANQWTVEGSNWGINGQAGNPAPSAEFSWDPIQTEYMQNLMSYPLCAVGMTEGNIWLDFDYRLQSVDNTGEEYLNVMVWNWDSQSWVTVASYTNADGNIAWTSENLNITSYAKNKVFRVGFQAGGMNSLNILAWYVDNIHVYRTCDAPTDLTATAVAQQGIELNWTPPAGGGSIAEWIHWDDGVNYDAIGTGAAVEFDVAARWEPSQLVTYEGASVTQISFYPYEAAATYRVRVWLGAGPANMVVDQLVASPLIDQWNTVTLDTPVPIDISQELWVGYYVNATTGYPAGCDDGPAIDGYGNMMNFGGWQTLLQINPDLDYNWNIQAYVETMSGATMPIGMEVESHSAPAGQLTQAPNYVADNAVFSPESGSRLLSGYNVWRNFEGGEYELIDFTTDVSYLDVYPYESGMVGLYCYMVQSVFENEETGDYCESAPSEEACELWTSITEPQSGAAFSLYPNPATSHVFVEATAGLKRVTVYNALGQLVRDQVTEGTQYELNTASYNAGIYMIRVETAEGVNTRTLTIQR